MIANFHQRGWHYLLLTILASLVFFLNLGGASLWDVDEGRNSTCFREMMEAENWIVPTFNGKLRVDKPALLYWLQILACQAFGFGEFAARFPSALAAFCTVLLVYELARSMFTRSTGLLAGVVIATTPMLCGAARFANPDALLNLFTVSTLALFWFGRTERRWWWFALLGVSAGLAVLAKGPVGVVLPGAVVTLFLLWDRRLSIAWDRRWLIAFWCFALTALPWYIWVGSETKGEFLRGFLLRHNLERGMSAMENHRGFPGYYLVVLLVGTMPWSIVLLASWWFGFWSAIREPWARCQAWWDIASEPNAQDREDDVSRAGAPGADAPTAYRFLWCWILVYLLFFSVAATKLPNYVLPIVGPCTILIARLLERWRNGAIRLPTWLLSLSIGALLFIGVLFAIGLTVAGGVGEWSVLRGRYYQGLEFWAPIGLVPIVAAVVGIWFVRRQQYTRFIVAVAGTAVLLLVPLAAFGSVLFDRYKATRTLVEQIDMLGRDHDIRVGGLQVEHLPSLNFYLQRNIEHLQGDEDVARFLAYRLPVYLFLPASDWERLRSQHGGSVRVVGRQYDFYHHTEIVVVTNQ